MMSGLMAKRSRIGSVFNRIDSGGEGADIAFGIADKALRTAGVSWSDLLAAYFDTKDTDAKPVRKANPNFADVFNSAEFGAFVHKRPTPHSQPTRHPNGYRAQKPGKPPRLSGNDIPSLINGKIKIHDRREAKHGPMLVVFVENPNGQKYGPLVIFNKNDIERVDNPESRYFYGSVTHAADPKHMPRLSRLTN